MNLVSKGLNPLLINVVERLGVKLLRSRQLFTVVGFLGAGAVLLPIHGCRDVAGPWLPTLLFSFANAFFGLAPCGFKSNYLDVTERYVGVVSGYGNTLGTAASYFGPLLVTTLLANFASWGYVFASIAIVNVIAAPFS